MICLKPHKRISGKNTVNTVLKCKHMQRWKAYALKHVMYIHHAVYKLSFRIFSGIKRKELPHD